jgi:hypothetical protein
MAILYAFDCKSEGGVGGGDKCVDGKSLGGTGGGIKDAVDDSNKAERFEMGANSKSGGL